MSELIRGWRLRTSAAASLELAIEVVADGLADAPPAELVELLDSFSPARAPGPEWVATFDRLIEQIWVAVDGSRIRALEAEYRARGPIWAAYANSFTAERGEQLRSARWHPKGARRAAVVLR